MLILFALPVIYQHFFSYRSLDAWNYFTSDVKVVTSFPAFKSAIKLVDLSAFKIVPILEHAEAAGLNWFYSR